MNIPITMGRAGNFGRFPVKFLYVSNMPVILTVALFANVALISKWIGTGVPILSKIMFYLTTYTTAPYGLVLKILQQGSLVGLGSVILQGIVYILILMIGCVVFGVLWVQMANQDSQSVANQLQKSGMFLPGFRRDPRVIKKVLDRYIPTITILGSAFVGLLAGFANLTGAVGTGMGILLTVDIVYRYYEDLAKEQLSDHKMLGKIMSMAKR